MTELKRWSIPYKKTEWGWFEVKAETKEKAVALFNLNGMEYDENSNKADYEIDYEKVEEM